MIKKIHNSGREQLTEVSKSTSNTHYRKPDGYPIIFVKDIFAAKLYSCFEVRKFDDLEGVEGRHCYIFHDTETPEVAIRQLAWSLGGDVQIYRSCQSLECLCSDKVTTQKELTIQIIEWSLSYKDWSARCNNEPLSIDEAREIGLAACKSPHLNELDRKTELANLAPRVEAGSRAAGYQWSKIVRQLEDEFRRELEKRGLSNNDDDERLRLALLELSQEKDRIAYIRKRAQICSYYRISKREIEELIKETERKTATNTLQHHSLDDLMDMEIQELSWLIPELLPQGEMVILGGSPKSGKTLMAIDAAFAIATGEDDFLGLRPQRGKVLLISNDENARSTKSKLLKRGFRKGDGKNLEIIFNWNISQLYELEGLLDEFRPDVVVIDSLKSITAGTTEVSENSAEFANNLYTLKNLFNKYNAASILIHHTNKNKDAMGVHKLRGSSAIAGAVWGTWQLDHIPTTDPNDKKKQIINPTDPRRILAVHARDVEGQLLKLEFDPENNSYTRTDEEKIDEQNKLADRILGVLRLNSDGLSGRGIIECLGMTREEGGRSVYTTLNRMQARKLISTTKSPTDKRVTLYISNNSQHAEKNSQQNSQQEGDSLSPLPRVVNVDYSSETITSNGLQNSQQKIQNSQQHTENSQHLKDTQHTDDYSKSLLYKDDSQLVNTPETGEGEGVLLNLPDNHTEYETKQPLQPQPQPGTQSDNQAISLLEIQQTGGDVSSFCGCNVEVRGMTGMVISRGVMVGNDAQNEVIIFETEKGDRKKASYREAYVIE